MKIRPATSAFSLIELAIVLAIMGLLAGGVMAGQSLIASARLNGVVQDLGKFKRAYNSFKDQYKAVPGDYVDATEVWGADTATACTTTPVASDRVPKTLTCNGDGSGTIHWIGGYGHGYIPTETLRVWQHLANAGFIDGVFSGVAGPNSYWHTVPGENMPALAFPNARALMATYATIGPADPMFSPGEYGTSILYGATADSWGSPPYLALFTPKQQYSIDTKLDDGLPQQGDVKIRFGNNVGCSLDNSDLTAGYALGTKTVACSIMYNIDDIRQQI